MIFRQIWLLYINLLLVKILLPENKALIFTIFFKHVFSYCAVLGRRKLGFMSGLGHTVTNHDNNLIN